MPDLTPELQSRFSQWELIGSGGMGIVYRAFDEIREHFVAIKFLHAIADDSESVVRRFKREFLSISKLSHPNIVQVYEFGNSYGRYFFVMEYLRGQTLKNSPLFSQQNIGKNLMTNPSCSKKFATTMLHTLTALAYIHHNRIVHRDLKPDNVFILEHEDVKLLDFGLIRPLDLSYLSTTQSSGLIGTPAYMSPEQIMNIRVDHRSDLYSFGVILYEAFTGSRPFKAETIWELIRKHVEETPALPTLLNPLLTKNMETVLMRLLHKDPERRIQSAEEAMFELRQHFPAFSRQIDSIQPDVNPIFPLLFNAKTVGRTKELQQIRELLIRLPEVKEPAVILIEGSPGVGKSRIFSELQAQLCFSDLHFLTASCMEETMVPYHGFSPILHSLHQICQRLFSESERQRFQDHWRWLEPYMGDHDKTLVLQKMGFTVPDAVEAKYEKERVRVLVADLLFAVAEKLPLAIFIDDVHWADRNTWELIEYLIGICEHRQEEKLASPLAFVFAYRFEELSTENKHSESMLTEIKRYNFVHDIHIEPLKPAETLSMIQSMLGTWCPPLGIAAKIYSQTAGMPLFIEETVRALVESGMLVKKDGMWQFQGDQSSSSERDIEDDLQLLVPSAIRKMILRRFKRFSPQYQKVLQTAACLGSRFAFEYLRAALAIPENELLASLDYCLKAQVLKETVSGSHLWFQFHHDFFRKIIVNMLEPNEKYALHLQIATGLEQLKLRGDHIPYDELAHHYIQARQPLPALKFGMVAVQRASRRLHFDKAAYLLTGLYELTTSPELRQRRERILLLLCKTQHHLGEFERVEQLSNQLLAQSRNPYLKAEALLLIGAGYQQQGYIGKALEYYEKSVALLGKRPAQRLRGALLWRTADCYRRNSNIDKCLELCLQGLETIDGIKFRREYLSLEAVYAFCFYIQGKLQEAETILVKCSAAADDAGFIDLKIQLLTSLTAIYEGKGECEKAAAEAHNLLELSGKLHFIDGKKQNLSNLAAINIKRANYTEAVEQLQQCIELCKKSHDHFCLAKCYNDFGLVHYNLGEWDEAVNFFNASLDLAEQFSSKRTMSSTLDNLAILYMKQGKTDLAGECANRSLKIHQASGNQIGYCLSLCILAENATVAKEFSAAEKTLNEVSGIVKTNPNSEVTANLRLRQADLYLHRKEDERALEELESAVMLAQVLKIPDIQGIAYRLQAIALQRLGQNLQAREAIEQSIAIFRRIKAMHELKQCYIVAGEIL